MWDPDVGCAVEACTKKESVGIWPETGARPRSPSEGGRLPPAPLERKRVPTAWWRKLWSSGAWTHRRLVTEFFEDVAAQETVRVLEVVLKWLFEKGRSHSRRWARPGSR